MKLNVLLRAEGIDPATTAIILHLATLQPLRNLLSGMSADHPDLFDLYQSVHSVTATAVLRHRTHAASFVPRFSCGLTLAGIFAIHDLGERPVEEIYTDPRFTRLEEEFGAVDTSPAANIARGGMQRQFHLERLPILSDLVGRLEIDSPPGRAYVRIAANLDADIRAILPEARFYPPPPNWRDFVLEAKQVSTLPPEWEQCLAQWRGIYLILDRTDGQRYVGSAYGQENLLGRWRAHVAKAQGVTAELGQRDTTRFRFSILERLGPDSPAEEVIALEQNWKRRLDTNENGLNRQ